MPKIELITADEVMTVGDADVEIVIRRIHPDVYREIRARHTRTVEEAGGVRRSEADEGEIDKDVLDYVIQAWPRGVVMPGGAAAPCTRAMKAALPSRIRTQILTLAFGAINTEGAESGELKNLRTPSGPPAQAAGPITPA